jgi:AcrR family transcriptional regulator
MQLDKSSAEVSEQRKRGRPARDIQPVLEAAIAVFAREGFGAATIEMIATEACVSTATLYKRFTNKQGLFAAVLEQTTRQSLCIHTNNRQAKAHDFSAILGRLEAHATVCSDPQVRGVMRAWVGEVRNRTEIGEIFARNSGMELVAGLTNQLAKLEEDGLVDIGVDSKKTRVIAAQIMLGIVERFTLTRGLILGDEVSPMISARQIAEKAVHAMMGIWGTPKGLAAFLTVIEPSLH